MTLPLKIVAAQPKTPFTVKARDPARSHGPEFETSATQSARVEGPLHQPRSTPIGDTVLPEGGVVPPPDICRRKSKLESF
jgi:hypothetical protein